MAPTLAVLTGAGIGGIGYAVAAHLASLGTRVVLADIDASALLGARLALIQGGAKDEDVLSVRSDVSCIENMLLLRGAVKKWGGKEPDFLFLNAGVQLPSKSIGTDGPDVDAWKSILDVNLYGVINGVQTFAEGMIKQSTATGTKAQIVITGSKQYVSPLFPPSSPLMSTTGGSLRRPATPPTMSPRRPSKFLPNPSPTPSSLRRLSRLTFSYRGTRSPSSPRAERQSHWTPSQRQHGLLSKSRMSCSSGSTRSSISSAPITYVLLSLRR